MGYISDAIERYSAIVGDMTDDGVILDWPKCKVIRTVHSNEHLRVLRMFCSLLMDSEMTCNETKVLLKNRYMKVADVPKHLYIDYGISISKDNARNKITKDIKALIGLLGDKFEVDAILYGNNMAHYEAILIRELIKYKSDPLGDLLGISLGYEGSACNAGDLEARADKVIKDIRPYLLKSIKETRDRIDYGALNYIRYSILCGENGTKYIDKLLDLEYVIE